MTISANIHPSAFVSAKIAKIGSKGKVMKLSEDRLYVKYEQAPYITIEIDFSFPSGEETETPDNVNMMYIMKEDGSNLFDNHIDLNELRRQGVPMDQFYNDFFNNGYSVEDQNGNAYLYLTDNPVGSVNKMNAVSYEDEDRYCFHYPETNLVFVILKSCPLNQVRVFDRDDEEESYFSHVPSDQELLSHGVDHVVFGSEFKGFILVSDDVKFLREIGA